MVCQKCNFQNEENTKFCKNCGTELTNNSKKNMRNGFGITGFVISLISIFAFSAFTDNSNENAPPLIGVIVFAAMGVIFSCLGFLQKNKAKWQAISGLTISGVILITTIIGRCLDLF